MYLLSRYAMIGWRGGGPVQGGAALQGSCCFISCGWP